MRFSPPQNLLQNQLLSIFFVSFRNCPREVLSKQLQWTQLVNRAVNYDVLYQVSVETLVINKDTNTTDTLQTR